MPSTQEIVRQELLKLLSGVASGQKDITPVGPYYHGNDSIFGSMSGVNKEFISLVIQPQGIGSIIPAYGSVYTSPEYGYITGFMPATGNQPEGVCDDGPTPGPVVTCLQTARFGRYRMDTRAVEINRIGEQRNYADPNDLRVLNGPLMANLGGLTPQSAFNSGDAMFTPKNEMLARMGESAREIGEILLKQVWFGDPANDTAGGGHKQFPGLNMLIGTTKLDSRTGTPCDLLKSDIKPFECRDVTHNGGQSILDVMRNIAYTRRFIASRTNMGQVVWRWVMRENAFRELVKVLPCAMATMGCAFPSGNLSNSTLFVSATEQMQLQQDMWDNRYLLIDGTRYEVVFDDAIPEESQGDGCFCSDMYFIPFVVKGNIPVLYWEYLDYTQGAMVGAEQGRYAPGTFWTDSGRYLWWNKPNNNVCVQLGMKTEPRLIFLTPHLAGRITDVGYCALQHAPDPFYGDPYYTLTGEGVRTRTGHYSDWNDETPGF